MKGLYKRQRRQKDLLVKIYIPSDLIEKTERKMINRPEGNLRKKAWRFAFQNLVESFLIRNDTLNNTNIHEDLSINLMLFELMADIESERSASLHE